LALPEVISLRYSWVANPKAFSPQIQSNFSSVVGWELFGGRSIDI
jgi:hypothetical protein